MCHLGLDHVRVRVRKRYSISSTFWHRSRRARIRGLPGRNLKQSSSYSQYTAECATRINKYFAFCKFSGELGQYPSLSCIIPHLLCLRNARAFPIPDVGLRTMGSAFFASTFKNVASNPASEPGQGIPMLPWCRLNGTLPLCSYHL